MPRIARAVAIDLPHHITQRGNYQQVVFQDDTDFLLYLRWLQEISKDFSLDILSYCLMPNHVHFLVVPHYKDSLAKTFNILQMKYAQYFNKKNGLKGHLWQGRFYSCILDQMHLYAALRYIERNPVRAGLVKEPWGWIWSSALAHVSGERSNIDLADITSYIEQSMDFQQWRKFILETDEEKDLKLIRGNVSTGRPVGSKEFVAKLEKEFNRRLTPLSRGRPKKQ